MLRRVWSYANGVRIFTDRFGAPAMAAAETTLPHSHGCAIPSWREQKLCRSFASLLRPSLVNSLGAGGVHA